MADEQPKKVTVEALKFHTNAGEAYQVGDTYDVEEHAVDNLTNLGMAVRTDRVNVAKADTKAAETAAKAAAKPAKPAKKGKR
jgi:hypothetical protein